MNYTFWVLFWLSCLAWWPQCTHRLIAIGQGCVKVWGSPPPATACDRLRPLGKFPYMSSTSITHTLPPSLFSCRFASRCNNMWATTIGTIHETKKNKEMDQKEINAQKNMTFGSFFTPQGTKGINNHQPMKRLLLGRKTVFSVKNKMVPKVLSCQRAQENMYVERSQPIVRSCRALKRVFLVKNGASQALATACNRLRPLATPSSPCARSRNSNIPQAQSGHRPSACRLMGAQKHLGWQEKGVFLFWQGTTSNQHKLLYDTNKHPEKLSITSILYKNRANATDICGYPGSMPRISTSLRSISVALTRDIRRYPWQLARFLYPWHRGPRISADIRGIDPGSLRATLPWPLMPHQLE